MGSPRSSPRAQAKKQKTSSDDKLTLYSYWRSSCSWRVRIVLNLKGLDYDYKAVHLVKDGGEQFGDAFDGINKNHRVPALKVGEDVTITQSGAIIKYLDEIHPDVPMLPKGSALEKARVIEVCDIIGNDIQPVQNLAVLKRAMSLVAPEDKDATKISWGHYWIDRGFEALESVLKTTHGKYCVGDNITMADAYLVPQVYNANRFKVDMSKFPIISKVHSSLEEHDAFKDAHPSKMPDAMA